VEVDDRPQLLLGAPVEGGVEQRESLLARPAGLVEELLLVHRDPQVVEAELRREGHVLAGEEPTPLLALRWLCESQWETFVPGGRRSRLGSRGERSGKGLRPGRGRSGEGEDG